MNRLNSYYKTLDLKISLKDIIDSKISEISNLANIKLENKNYKANKISLYQALKTKVDATGFGIIAEIKRKAPSMGDLSSIDDPIALAKEYVKHNAAGISVLTDKTWKRILESCLSFVKKCRAFENDIYFDLSSSFCLVIIVK